MPRRGARRALAAVGPVLLVAAFLLALATCQGHFDPCRDVACSGHGACVASGGSATCACFAGFRAEGLECLADPADGDADVDGDSDLEADGDADLETDGGADAETDVETDGSAEADIDVEIDGEPVLVAFDDFSSGDLNGGFGWARPWYVVGEYEVWCDSGECSLRGTANWIDRQVDLSGRSRAEIRVTYGVPAEVAATSEGFLFVASDAASDDWEDVWRFSSTDAGAGERTATAWVPALALTREFGIGFWLGPGFLLSVYRVEVHAE